MSNYTIYFYEYLDIIGGSENLPSILSDMPAWENQSFVDRFIERNYYKEIGAETVELFTHYLEREAKEMYSNFNAKIEAQMTNFSKLYDRVAKENSSFSNLDYYNPINGNSAKVQGKVSGSAERERVFGWLKSNPEIMAQVNKVNIVFEEALRSLDILFMGII